MFVRRYQRTKDGKRHTYFALVESCRTGRGPRQGIVAQLGELSEDQERRWQRTAVFHTRHEEGHEFPLFPEADPGRTIHDPDVVRILLGKVGWTNARAFGDVWLGWQLWRKLGLDRIVAGHIRPGREAVAPATMVAIEVIARLCIGQGGETSEFGLAEQGYRRTALEDLLGVPDEAVTKDRLYRTLDALLEAKTPIEQAFKEQLGELFGLPFDLLLCDLTSSFFEGLMEDNARAKRGHSRDHRRNGKQIVLVLVVMPDGFPVYHQVFAGNTHDAVAFPRIVETMASHLGRARRVWVLDRGMATQANLDFLRAERQSFRAMKTELWLRPMWHQVGPRIQAHVLVCVLAYALWKALAHLLHYAGLMARARKTPADAESGPPDDRPMSPAAALRILHDVQIGDILLTTVEGRKLRLRRVARPNAEQAELLTGLKLTLPERICADRDVTPKEFATEPPGE